MAYSFERISELYPSDWVIVPFGDITKETQLGTTARGNNSNAMDVPLLKMGNIKWGGFDLSEYELIHNDHIESCHSLCDGDFLFNTRNTPELVGKSSVWHEQLSFATFDNNINRIRFNTKADPDFICMQLTFGPGKGRVRSLSAGSTSVAAIYWKDLKKLRVALPPLPEQKKIARILSTWDKAIETVDKLIENSQQQKKALMQQLLTGKKRLPGFSGEWKEYLLGEICTPKQWPTISSSQLAESGYPVYGANGFIGYYHEFNHEEESIAVTCRGSTCGEIRIVPQKSYITGNSMSLDNFNKDVCVPRFIYYLLKFRGIRDVISGSAQPQIIGKDLKKLKVQAPSLKER